MLGEGLLREKKGHGFDAVSPGILLARAKAKDGCVVFAEGSSYRVLVLPLVATMTAELLAKIEELVRAGVTVIGVPPVKSPSLTGYPKCDEEVAALAQKLWGGREVPAQITERRYRKGRIMWGGESTVPASADKLYPSYASTVALLQKWKIPSVFASSAPVRWHQRRSDERDIFFVSNREAKPVETVCGFRTDGASPELWDALTGTSRPLPDFAIKDGTVEVPLRFAANEGYFVVFNRKTKHKVAAFGEKNFPEEKTVTVIDGSYEVTFDPLWGGPKVPVVFPTLTAWNTSADEGIKYYSGKAVYRKLFSIQPSVLNGRAYLDLGVVHKLAAVKLNGEDLGIVWTPPYRVEVTGKLRPAVNELEITVVNTWVNRLIGDQQPGNKDVRKLQWESGLLAGKPQPAGRYTFTTAKGDYTAASPLQESGLLGPVTLSTTLELRMK